MLKYDFIEFQCMRKSCVSFKIYFNSDIQKEALEHVLMINVKEVNIVTVHSVQ